MTIIFRRAGRRDLKDIHALWQALRELEAKSDPRLALRKEAIEILRDHREVVLADSRTGIFVAEEAGEILGYVHAQIEINDPRHDPPKLGRIVDLIAREERRRQGIGTRLLGTAKEWLASMGMSEYRTTLPVHLPDGQRFFERAGAQVCEVTLRSRL